MTIKELKEREEELEQELKHIRHRRKCLNAFIESTSTTFLRNHPQCNISPLEMDKWLMEITDEKSDRQELLVFLQNKIEEKS